MTNGEKYISRSGKAPGPGEVAKQVMGAAVAKEPVEALSWATAADATGKPLYMIVVVLGSENCNRMDRSLKKLVPHMERVDTFDGQIGEPIDGG